MQEVEAVCDQVIIINKGQIVANDSLEGLRNKNNGKSLENIFIDLTNKVAWLFCLNNIPYPC